MLDSIRIEYENAAKNKIPSLNVLIHTPEDYIFVSSTAPGETPVTENTYFRFGSNTKNFTATSILNMQEDGWLDIKSKITDLFPEALYLIFPIVLNSILILKIRSQLNNCLIIQQVFMILTMTACRALMD